MVLPLLLLGCRSNDAAPEEVPSVESVPVARMYRLTEAELRATVQAVFGVTYVGALPGDYVLHGYRSVGAGVLTVNPSELEAYETAAWAIATDAVADASAAHSLLRCRPTTTLGHPPEDDGLASCVASGVAPLATRAWRRPVTAPQLDRLVELWSTVRNVTDSDAVATQSVVVALILAPEFLYRIEVGEPAPDGGNRRFTAWELASRLSYFLTDAPPDEALRTDAATGALHDPDVVVRHAERLFDSPAGRRALGRFWEETLELDRLDAVTKDPAAYPEFDDGLRQAMKVEIRRMFEQVVFESDAPLGSLLTTDVTFVDDRLAALYGLSGSGQTVRGSLEGTGRGGILGRAALLSIWSHATSSSPTLRGKFLRTRMLCQAVPPPPEGVVASLDAVPREGTARERLAAHASDPACRGCHQIMDPPGFAFEHFDAIGRWRDDDQGFAIDPSGALDGVAFADARELGAAVAAHPEFPGCVALQLFRHAVGAETHEQLPAIERLGVAFAEADQSLRALVSALVRSDAFRLAELPEGGGAGCGSGVESCNGVDDDCDGEIDEEVVTECELDGVRGVSDCERATCETPAPDPEICNAFDDDRDGLIDEGRVLVTPVALSEWTARVPDCDPQSDGDSLACRLAMRSVCDEGCGAQGFATSERSRAEHAVACVPLATPVQTTFDHLAGYHPACTAETALGPDCKAAIHRMCAQTGWVTGWGPVDHDGVGASVVCVDEAVVTETTYTAMGAFEPGCDGVEARTGPPCNRAIHRFCQSNGHASGFGPLENLGDTAFVACLGEAP